MRAALLALVVLALSPLAGFAQAVARPGELPQRRGKFFAHPFAGYFLPDKLFRTSGGVAASLGDGAMYGGQLGFRLSPNIALVGGVGSSLPHFDLGGVPAPGGGTRDIASDLRVVFYDLALETRLPIVTHGWGGRITPLIQVGTGAMSYSFAADELRDAGGTRWQGNVGAGADIRLTTGLAVRLLARDYLTSLHWRDDDPTFAGVRKDGRLTNNWATTAGLAIDF